MRVPAHAHADQLDERRALAVARALDRPGERRRNLVGIGAVDRDAGNAVARCLVGEHAHGGLLAHRRRQRRLVVLDAEDGGQPARRAEIDRLVPLAERRAALADERQRDAARPSRANASAMPAIVRVLMASGAAAGRMPDVEVADVQVLAVHRRARLRHLRGQHHAHGLRLRAHRERHAEIADERRDDVAAPAAIRPVRLAAAQPDPGGVDRFLPERSESLALERRVAVPDLPLNSLDDRDCDPQAVKVLTALGKSSDLGVPIVVEGETWGEVWASKGIGEPPFRAEDINFLEAIAGQFATAIARAELFSRVSRLAYEDALTGLPNRRAFDERLERALNRSRERGTRLAMLLCDLDGLKQINDGSGHEAGDRALRDAADALVAAAADRPGAFVARIAGDEFCVLLEDRSLDDAIAIGAGAIAELSRSAAEHSLSCGAATATETTETPGDLLNAADRALYAAKRRGGAQVCIAKDGPTGSLARRQLRRSASLRDRIATASEALIADLDERLASAPALDRLEAVASAYTEAADLASWTISLAAPGRDLLVDLSLGDNRDDEHQGVRVGPGTDKYRLSHYPATARIVAAGSGCFSPASPIRRPTRASASCWSSSGSRACSASSRRLRTASI